MTDRELMQQALEALKDTHYRIIGAGLLDQDLLNRNFTVATALRERLEQPPQQEKLMPITDDHGQSIRPQYRVIEQRGQWQLLYDQHQVGNVVTHEFRVQKLIHDIVLYPGITLAEAQKRFHEKVEADHE